MSDVNIFNISESDFPTKERYEEYRAKAKCAVCHKRLEIGDKFTLRPIQTPEQSGSLTVQAVVVHTNCLDEECGDVE